MKFFTKKIMIFFLIGSCACSSIHTSKEAESQLVSDLTRGDFEKASHRLETYRQKKIYVEKDRVLFYLNKGLVLHYQQNYDTSNHYLERADRSMEDLFTRSVSKAMLSAIANDNVLDYSGEVYDNLYVNIFKALNYLALNSFEEAYVEIKRVNDKLRELDVKYGDWVNQWNRQDTTGIKIENRNIDFYDDALAHYLSYLIFRAEGEEDNARISFENIKNTWDIYPDVYGYPLPDFLQDTLQYPGIFLNVMAFTGNTPQKIPGGGEITTFENFIIVSDARKEDQKILLNLAGLEEGWHFKFSFPELSNRPSMVEHIRVTIDDYPAGNLQLLEDMGKVASYTFESKKNIIYFKTLARTLVKGLASHRTKEKVQEETGTEKKFLLRNIINLGIDAIFDATENPDLRIWSTLPRYCFAGEYPLDPGIYRIKIQFLDINDAVLSEQFYPDYEIKAGLNLLEAVYLN
jgi:hypothetical protein